MKYLPVWFVFVALLSACAGGSHKAADETVQNPYIKRAKTLTDAGIFAMQRERWEYARNVFERALKEAQLADNPRLVAQQWYNLGTANAAAKHNKEALHDFSEARIVAERAGDQTGLARARLAWVLLTIRTGKQPANANIWQPDVFAMDYPVDVHLAAARLAQKQQRRHVAKQEYEIVLKKSGKFRPGLLSRGQAYLGLAMLAREEQNMKSAKRDVEKSLDLLRQAGSPRLIAHALLFYGKLEVPVNDRRDALQRALVIYQRLDDTTGQRDCLTALVELENHTGSTRAASAYQQRLKSLQHEQD
ncbi:MAG: hypothetical protein Q9M12_05950 [Mariprofundus sp.]|nr:hypothetical protein [Mariprofundus sp.]